MVLVRAVLHVVALALLLSPYDVCLAGAAFNGVYPIKGKPSTGTELLVFVVGSARRDANFMSQSRQGGYTIEPLFATAPYTYMLQQTQKEAAWLVVTPVEGVHSPNSWDAAHHYVRDASKGLYQLFQSIDSIYAEPNELHEMPYAGMPKEPPDKSWPHSRSLTWHLGDSYTQLTEAQKAAKKSSCTARAVILDTGIYPKQISTPRNVIKNLEKDFLDGDNDATDPGTSGVLKNPGHGTATVAVLAGNRVSLGNFDGDVGGAPDAQVVPVRISDSVVHFWTKEMAQGIDYAAAISEQGGTDFCEVVSISMGGVASRAWASAVNRAYERGVLIVAAAGNNFGDFPTRYTVYPSRFNRVVTVTGATLAFTAYRTDKNPGAKGMQGNYGPPSVMRHAIAAFTPNIVRAEWGTTNKFSANGAGTSYATPQVAAAALLWLQSYGGQYRGWQRVEAARVALFQSADKSRPESTAYFGNGILRAADALQIVPNVAALKMMPEDEVSFPLFRILLGLDEPSQGEEKMYEVEALNIALRSPDLVKYTDDIEDKANLSAKEQIDVIRRIHDDKRASTALKRYLEERAIDRKR
jgi:hypothetical protein